MQLSAEITASDPKTGAWHSCDKLRESQVYVTLEKGGVSIISRGQKGIVFRKSLRCVL